MEISEEIQSSSDFYSLLRDETGIWKSWRTGEPGDKYSKRGQKPATNSTQMWHQFWESNTCTYWREANALTTAQHLLPCHHNKKCSPGKFVTTTLTHKFGKVLESLCHCFIDICMNFIATRKDSAFGFETFLKSLLNKII